MAAVGAASAQSSVTVSGALVLGVGKTEIGTANSGLQIARQTGNIAFKGTEDLGGGLKAGFEVQTSIGAQATTNTTTSVAANRTLLGDRALNMSVSGGFGTVLVGRGNTAVRTIFGAMGDVSGQPVVTGLSAGSSAAATSTGGSYEVAGRDANARVIYGDTFANQVTYLSPAFSGLTFAVAVAPVQAVDTNIGDNAANKDTTSLSAIYAAGPIGVAYNITDAKGGAAPYKLNTLVASYDFGVAKVGFTRQSVNLATGIDPADGTAVTLNVPFGPGSFGAGYGKRGASASTNDSFGDDVKQSFVGYKYNLSKRTAVSATFNKINRAGAATDIKETHVLVGHSF